jgi:hypothetical protein
MRKLLLSTALVGLAFAGTANAAPIDPGSVLNIVGSANFNATQVLTTNPAGLAANTGSFSPLINCLSCVTVNQPVFTYSPSVGTGLLFTVNEGGLTASVTLDAGGTAELPAPTALAIEAPATLTMTGFDPTNGTVTWTINQATNKLIGSFSATAEAVPEPTTLALMGVGLLGLGFTQMRRRR